MIEVCANKLRRRGLCCFIQGLRHAANGRRRGNRALHQHKTRETSVSKVDSQKPIKKRDGTKARKI
jgi:hypothetical protein